MPDAIRETRHWILSNLLGASESFAIGYEIQFGDNSEKLINQRDVGLLMIRCSNYSIRHSASCLSRVWDQNTQSRSLRKLINQLSQNHANDDDFIEAKKRYEEIVASAEYATLRVMRDKMLAHTQGIATTEENSLDLPRYAKLLDETWGLVRLLNSMIDGPELNLDCKSSDIAESATRDVMVLAGLVSREE